jgi:hypothetical protein
MAQAHLYSKSQARLPRAPACPARPLSRPWLLNQVRLRSRSLQFRLAWIALLIRASRVLTPGLDLAAPRRHLPMTVWIVRPARLARTKLLRKDDARPRCQTEKTVPMLTLLLVRMRGSQRTAPKNLDLFLIKSIAAPTMSACQPSCFLESVQRSNHFSRRCPHRHPSTQGLTARVSPPAFVCNDGLKTGVATMRLPLTVSTVRSTSRAP